MGWPYAGYSPDKNRPRRHADEGKTGHATGCSAYHTLQQFLPKNSRRWCSADILLDPFADLPVRFFMQGMTALP
jgi:hypothetical protein